jgi:N-acyl-D-amino-acid deacylase
MRGYTPANAPTALAEVFAIGRGAGCPVHISHFNCLADQAIPILEQAQSDCTFDLYCYLYGSTTVAMLTLPADVCVGGIDATLDRLRDPAIRKMLIPSFKNPRFPLETIRLASCPHPDWRQYEGQFLTAAAGSRPVVDFVCDLLIATDLAAGCVIRHFADRQESDILKLMRHPAMMAGSDGIFIGGFPHPRGAGCFARYLGHHVRRGDWPLEEAVRKCSFAAAERFQLKDRGIIRPGAFADLAIFDPVRFTDQSTLTNGRALAIGMKWVFVNGSCVFDGRPTGQTPGRALRRGES